VKARCEKLQNQAKLREAQEIQRKHIQRFIDRFEIRIIIITLIFSLEYYYIFKFHCFCCRFRYNAKRASLVQSRIKLLQKMEVIPDVVEDPTLSFTFPQPEPLHPPLIQVIDVSFGYTKEKLLFRNLNFNLDFDSRIAMVSTSFKMSLFNNIKQIN
jgi:ATP-binding cassette subfamily F protein 3